MTLVPITLLFFAVVLAAVSCALVFAGAVLRSTGHTQIGSVEPSSHLLRQEAFSSIAVLARLLERLDFSRWIDQRTREAELEWSAGRVTFMILFAGASTFAISMRLSFIPLPVAILLAAGAACFPISFILRKRTTRLRRFQEHFPDSIDSLCRALRAGHPFAAGVEMIANEGVAPVGIEFRRMLDEWRLGASWNEALNHFANRIPLTETGIFCAAVKQQMRSGGRLGEVLARLSEGMREAASIEGEVRATAAQARLSGRILTFLPAVIAATLFYVNPDQMRVLTSHPWGRIMIWTAMGLIIVAHLVIRKISNVRY